MKTTRHTFRHFLLIVMAITGVNFVAPAPTGAVTCGLTDVNLDGFLEVHSQADLEEIKSNSSCLNASFFQTASFTISSLSAVELGQTAPFTGRYNGGNHTITFNVTTSAINGLFYETLGATISNLNLAASGSTSLAAGGGWLVRDAYDTTVTRASSSGNVTDEYSGGLIGLANGTTVSNSYTTGDINSSGDNSAGLISQAYGNTTVNDSYTTGDITSSGDSTAGLISLALNNTTVNNSYTTGDITSSDYSAGLISQAYDNITVTNSYTTGDINGSDYSAGLIATVQNPGADNITVTNVYTTGDINGQHSGGLIAEVTNFFSGNITVSNVYTTGDINGQHSGGLIAEVTNLFSGNITVSNVYTTGDINGQHSYGLIRVVRNLGSGTIARSNEFHDPDDRWSTADASHYLTGEPTAIPGRGSVWGACADDTPFFLVVLNNGSCLPVIPVWRVTLDPNGGTCTDSTARTELWTSAFVGYRYLPGASDCTKPGHTFTGWANTTTPTIPVDLPLLDDPSDGTKRTFIASNANLTAIWTKNPEPKAPTIFVALNGFFCRNCGNWLIWNQPIDATSVTVTSGTRTVCTTLKITIDQWTLCHDPQPPRGPQTYTLTANNGTTTSPPITATTRR